MGVDGSVTFYDGMHPLGRSMIVNGIAGLTVPSLSAGGHTLTAVYPGNSYHVPHRSNAVTELSTHEDNVGTSKSGTGYSPIP